MFIRANKGSVKCKGVYSIFIKIKKIKKNKKSRGLHFTLSLGNPYKHWKNSLKKV